MKHREYETVNLDTLLESAGRLRPESRGEYRRRLLGRMVFALGVVGAVGVPGAAMYTFYESQGGAPKDAPRSVITDHGVPASSPPVYPEPSASLSEYPGPSPSAGTDFIPAPDVTAAPAPGQSTGP